MGDRSVDYQRQMEIAQRNAAADQTIVDLQITSDQIEAARKKQAMLPAGARLPATISPQDVDEARAERLKVEEDRATRAEAEPGLIRGLGTFAVELPIRVGAGALVDIGNEFAATVNDFLVAGLDHLPGGGTLERRLVELASRDTFAGHFYNSVAQTAFEDSTTDQLRLKKAHIPGIQDPSTAGGKMVRDITSFVVPLIAGTTALKKVKALSGASVGATAARGAIAGGVVDFTFLDESQANLAAMAAQVPGLDGAVTDFLATDKEDPALLNRFRNLLEGQVAGGSIELAVKGLRVLRAGERLRGGLSNLAGGALEIAGKAEKPVKGLADEAKKALDKAIGAIGAGGKIFGGKVSQEVREIVSGVANTAEIANSYKNAVAALEGIGVRQSNKKTIQAAAKINPLDLLKLPADKPLSAAQNVAARGWAKVFDALVADADALFAAKEAAGTLTDKDRAVRSILKAAGVQFHALDIATASATGLALQSRQIADEALEKVINKTLLTKKALDFDLSDTAVQRLLIDGGGTKAIDREIRRAGLVTKDVYRTFITRVGRHTSAGFAKAANVAEHLWMSSLLSSARLVPRNILSGLTITAADNMARVVASMFGPAVNAKEVTHAVHGQMKAVTDAFLMAGKVFKDNLDEIAEVSRFGQGRSLQPISRKLLGESALQDFPPLAWGLDFMGYLTSLPTRGVIAGDVFVGEIASRGALHAGAFRRVLDEGLDIASDKGAALYKSIIEDPPVGLLNEMIEISERVGLRAPLGKTGTEIEAAIRKMPFSRAVVPFYRPGVNMAKIMVVHSPFGVLAPSVLRDIAAGGALQQMALARMSVGSMIAAAFTDLASQGLLTGNSSAIRRERRSDERPERSIKAGDTWIQLPAGIPMTELAVSAADIWERAGDLDDPDLENAQLLMILEASETFVDEISLGSLSKLLEFAYSPNKETSAKRLQKFLDQLGATARRPQFQRDIRLQADPVRREVDSFKDRVMNRGPESVDLPPMRDVMGRPMELPAPWGGNLISPFGIFNPILVSPVTDDPVMAELRRLDAPIDMPSRSRSIRGATVRLEQREYDGLVRLARGEAYREDIKRVMASPLYEGIGDTSKAEWIRDVTRKHDSRGWELYAQQHPEIINAINTRLQERIDEDRAARSAAGGL